MALKKLQSSITLIIFVFCINISFAQTVTVDINAATKYQTMQGFGSSIRLFDDPHVFENFDPATQRAATTMTTAQQDEILDKLYTELKFTRVRPATEAGIEIANDNTDPNTTDLSKFNFAWKRNDGYIDYMKRVIPRGVNTYFLSPITLETWMDENNPEEYVEWAMALITRWKNMGVELPYYSIVNEPGYSRSGIWSGEYLRDVIKLLGAKLEANGFKTKIITPDDLNSTQAYNRSQIILSDPDARKYVAALAFHLYDEPVSNVSKMQQLSMTYNIPLWMTEYSTGASGRTAIGYASMMHDLIATYDVTAIDYMWGYFGQWEGGNASLITLLNNGAQYNGYRYEKSYYTIGQFSRFIKQGAQRISASSSGSAVKVTAYMDGTTTTIVAINTSANPQTTKFNFNGFNITKINGVRTSSAENWASLPSVNVNSPSYTTTLPPNSITTFTTDNNITGNTEEEKGLNQIIQIYPNPTRSVFTVLYENNQGTTNLKLTIKNNLGQEVYSKSYLNFNDSLNESIDLNTQAKGIYFLEIITDKGKEMKKIVVQ